MTVWKRESDSYEILSLVVSGKEDARNREAAKNMKPAIESMLTNMAESPHIQTRAPDSRAHGNGGSKTYLCGKAERATVCVLPSCKKSAPQCVPQAR